MTTSFRVKVRDDIRQAKKKAQAERAIKNDVKKAIERAQQEADNAKKASLAKASVAELTTNTEQTTVDAPTFIQNVKPKAKAKAKPKAKAKAKAKKKDV